MLLNASHTGVGVSSSNAIIANLCKKLLALLFPKKKEADADERPLLASIVVAMGRQHPHFAFSQLQELLQAQHGASDSSSRHSALHPPAEEVKK